MKQPKGAAGTETPPLRSVGRPRSERSETAILNAAMDILIEKGYRGFTIDEVVSRASVSKATIYRRWPSKELLAVAAVAGFPELHAVDTGSLEDDLYTIVSEFADVMQNTALGAVWPSLVGERSRNEELKAALDEMTEHRRTPTRQAFERAIERGELPEDLDLALAIDMIMGPVLLRLLFQNADTTPAALRKIIIAVLPALGFKPAKKKPAVRRRRAPKAPA